MVGLKQQNRKHHALPGGSNINLHPVHIHQKRA